jgi:hypothetical protein
MLVTNGRSISGTIYRGVFFLSSQPKEKISLKIASRVERLSPQKLLNFLLNGNYCAYNFFLQTYVGTCFFERTRTH